ncbi:DNA/RNA polymerases superfamily protein [Senna tora]|uniref:DNA/RNA polymerases superfamily protein n=1 Tax=Senna tora TaxID=362788 RepID=A0A834W4C4_9FABA|nr:DNA/RNA polymerases superfamily protein [Senna tora]
MSQREGIVEDVNDESSAHHEAPPPPEGRERGRSSGSNRGRGRPRGRGRTSRGGRAIEHLINDELVGNPMPQQIPMPQPNPMLQQNLASTQDVVLTGLQGVTRAVEALTSIIVDHVARTNTPVGEASRQVQGGPPGPQIPLVPQIPQERTTIGRQVGALPLDWGEFNKDFLERFLPESVREARAKEFLLFKQTSEMTVAEYSTQLIRLSKYAPHSTSTERELIKRFVQGLLPPLFRAMVSQINQFESYAVALDCATRIEMREKEDDDAAKKRKRGGEDRYGGSSTGGFSKGTKAHTHQRFSQSPSGFSAPSYVSPNRQRTDSQNTKSSTQQGSSQQKHNKSSCPTCGKFHSGLCYRGSGACYRCGKVGHLIRDCPQQRPESSQGSIQPTGHTTSSMGQSRGPSSNRSGGNDASRDSRGRGPHATSSPSFPSLYIHISHNLHHSPLPPEIDAGNCLRPPPLTPAAISPPRLINIHAISLSISIFHDFNLLAIKIDERGEFELHFCVLEASIFLLFSFELYFAPFLWIVSMLGFHLGILDWDL